MSEMETVATPLSTEQQLAFAKRLQTLSNRIHATANLDEIMLDLSQAICELFGCERLTLYAIHRERNVLYSKVKLGINSSKDLVLSLDGPSIAAFVANQRRGVRINDVYDIDELAAISPQLHFFDKVDQAVGYRTRQMLAAPIVSEAGQLLGVIQLLNRVDDQPFDAAAEVGLQQLCATMAVAFAQRIHRPLAVCSKYQSLVVDAVISEAELELAARWARRKGLDIEQVLLDEYQVSLEAIGLALSKAFRVPYEPFKGHRDRPAKLLAKLDREQAQQQQWLPLGADKVGLTVLTTDPDHANDGNRISDLFPYPGIFFRVTTQQEFRQTLAQLYG